MDIATNDKDIKGDERRLRSINACRLYHGVVHLKEMSHYTGETIQEGYLHGKGSYRNKTHRGWPVQPLPLDYQWDEWRQFIRKRFLQENSNKWKQTRTPSPRTCIKQQIDTPTQVMRTLLTTSRNSLSDTSLKYIIHLIPREYQPYLQVCETTSPETMQVLSRALYNETLHIATDGSHMPGTADGAGAAVAMDEDRDNILLWAGCKCDIEENMTSQTSEHYGAISGLLLIYLILCYTNNDMEPKPTIPFWIDNAEVLSRARKCCETRISLKEYSLSDYSHQEMLIQLTIMLKQWTRPSFQKVKSH